MSNNTASRLLQLWTAAMVAFGVATATIPWVREEFFGWVASGDTSYSSDFGATATDYLEFNQALLGALTAGLGLASFWFARIPIARREPWGWYAFASSIGLWFVIDNIASVAFGFPRNVVFNVILVAPALALLWVSRPPSDATGVG